MNSTRVPQILGRRTRALALIIGTVVTWELSGRLYQLRTDLLPTPSRISLEIWKEWPQLSAHARVTWGEIAGGFFLAALLAIPLAFTAAMFPGVDRLVEPILACPRHLPLVAAAPVLLIWFGFGTLSKVLLVSLLSFFPIASGTAEGLHSVPLEVQDLLHTMGATRWQEFLKVRLPACLPDLFKGLKAAATPAVVGAIVGELVAADKGLGYLLLAAHNKLNSPLLFAALVCLSFAAPLLIGAIRVVEREVIPWYQVKQSCVSEASQQKQPR